MSGTPGDDLLRPRQPRRPLRWPDAVLNLADLLAALPGDDAPDATVYIVGGAVRDAYLGRPVHDLDLVTPRGAIRLARALANSLGGDVFIMDAERDVARVLTETADGRLNIDVAGYRDHDLLGDLTARDFTLNALAVSVRDLGQLIDPLGGEADLNNRLLRRCAPASIFDDPVRALRAVRQSVQLNTRIEPETLRDLRAAAPRLYDSTSPERIRDELFKMLGGDKPATALRLAGTLGLLDGILPGVADLRATADWERALATVEKLSRIQLIISPQRTEETAASFELGMIVMGLDPFRKQLQAHLDAEWPNERRHSALCLLAGVLLWLPVASTPSAQATDFAERLRLSGGERARLAAILRERAPGERLLTAEITPLYAHRFWRGLGPAGLDVCLVALAHYAAQAGAALHQDTWLKLVEKSRQLVEIYYARHDEIVSPPVLLDGTALQAQLRLKPGPIIGELLEVIREAQVVGTVTSAEEALRVAEAHLAGRGA